MKKILNLIILLFISITFSGCFHIIEDDKGLIVREKRMSNYTKYKFSYELYNSAAISNVEFYSNRNFEIGDTIKLEVE
jgi:hypothetical protein